MPLSVSFLHPLLWYPKSLIFLIWRQTSSSESQHFLRPHYMILWPVSIELITAWVMYWHLGNFTDCYCCKIGMNYTASSLCSFWWKSSWPVRSTSFLSLWRPWSRFFQYNLSVRLSKDNNSKDCFKKHIKEKNLFYIS